MVDIKTPDLQREAQQLLKILRRQARRPFVFEITGTPKAGKTTLINLLDGFLRDCGWRVHILEERAGLCPLPMKGHFFFNTWTTGTMLAGLLDAIDRDDDIVILDRGLFDALIWLEVQRQQGQVSQREASAFADFILVDRWCRLSDATCVIKVDPNKAMERENLKRLIPRTGSVMNPGRLHAFNASLDHVANQHSDVFDVITLTNDKDAKDGATDLINTLLTQVRGWADKPIAVIPRETAERLVPNSVRAWNAFDLQDLVAATQFRLRSEIEDDDDWVQLLACGCQVFDDGVFLSVRRRQRAQLPSGRDDSARIWQGCHVEGSIGQQLEVGSLSGQLIERLCTDLHLGQLDVTPEPLGLIWQPDGVEPRHLGMIFKVPVEEKIKNFLDEKEFRTNGRGHKVESSFTRLGEIEPDTSESKGYTLEPWSVALLEAKWLP